MTDDDLAMLPLLTSFAELAIEAGYDLGQDLEQATYLELLARSAASRRLAVRQAVMQGKAASGAVGLADVLAEVDGGQAGADYMAHAGLMLARAKAARNG